jgi:uncharacterized protein YdeI (YjbR/CyaY-like superfamily)
MDDQLTGRYREWLPCRQNNYPGWIARAKGGETRQKRLAQMLHELKQGGVYMKMQWKPWSLRQG